MDMRLQCAAFAALLVGVALAVTDGWENVNYGRMPWAPPGDVVWTADLSRPTEFTFEKREGAEGSFSVVDRQIRIVKTNGKGFLLLKAKPFAVDTNRMMRVFADVRAEGAVPEFSHGMLCAYGKKESLAITQEALAAESGSSGGRMMSRGLVNMPRRMFFRKYVHYRSEDGVFTPAIVVAGEPSTSFWKNWTVEDHRLAKAVWGGVSDASLKYRCGASAPITIAELKSRLEKDVEHTAKVVRENGRTKFMVDGREEVPVAYRGVEHHEDFSDMGAAEPLLANGVRIVIPSLYINRYAHKNAWSSKHGFDAARVVDEFAETLRAEPDALFMAGFTCNAYPEFVDEHPGEGWVNKDGKQIYGWYAVSKYDGSRPAGSWPWVSYASKSWRNAICENIRAFVAELKRRGLQKRVVGIHINGYGDGQFNSNPTDFSKAAKEEYARYLAEGNCYSTNYTYFTRQLPQRAIDEFARAFKEAMGKDVVAIRWCDAPFVVSHDIEAFCRSKWVDIMVPQPNYSDRAPSLGCTLYPPIDTIGRYGKMVWSELDHRTWWVIVGNGLMSFLRSCPAIDIQAWRSSYRKLAGQMVAARQGFWFYDMQRGAFASPEIAADVGRSLDTMRRLAAKPASPWRPSVALVIDNTGFIGWDGGERPYPDHTYYISQHQMRLLSESGVPYEMLLAEDALEHPDLLDGMKTVVFMLWRKFDEKRIALVRRLSGEGRSLVFLAESGMCGGVKEATGFDVDFTLDKPMSFHVVPEPGVKEIVLGSADANEIRSDCRSFGRDPSKPMRSPVGDRRGSIVEEPGVKVLGRFDDDRSAAIAVREDGSCRRYYFCAPGGLSHDMLNRIARDSGAYVPVDKARMQVFMNGDFISVHALDNGRFAFKLPFACKVVNEKTGREEPTTGGILPLDLTAGETCWFTLERKDAAASLAPDGGRDMTKPFLDAVEKVRRSGGGAIDLAPGEYHFRNPFKRGWYVSNHDDPLPRNVFLPLEGLTNVTIRSPRAEFVFHGEGMAMGIVDSANVVLKGLAFDYSRPFNTEWRFLGFEGGEPLLETDPEKFPFSTEGGKLFTAGENLHVEEVVAEMFGGRNYETVGKDWVGSACERLSRGRIRLKAPLGGYRFVIPPEQGKSVFVMRARKRPNPAMFMYRASDVLLEDVIFRSSAGMGLVAQRSENITMRGTGKAAERTCGTFSRADSGRKTTLLADATHFSCCRGQITVENCTFERMMDDAINVHAIGLRVERIVPPSRLVCRFKHPQALGFEVFAPGETLRFIKTRTLENGAEAKIASVRTPSPDIVEIELACRVPDGCVEGDTVENADWQPSVRFAGNMVDRTVARGALFTTSGKVVCESNVFSHIYGPAIRVSGDSMNWYETGGCRNLAIRGNRFENCRTAYGAGVIAIDPEIADVAKQRERYHRGIVIEDNVFETHDVPLVWANSVKGLVWRRNRIVRNDAYRALHRAPLHFEHSEDVSVDGIPAEKHPKTTVVPDETLMLLVSGVDEVARMERDLVELSEERGVPLWFGNPHGMLNAALRDGRWRTLLLDEDEATSEKLTDIRGRAAPYVEIVIQTRKTNASKWSGLRTVHVGNATGRTQAEIVANTLFPHR